MYLQILVVFWFLKNNAEFEYHNNSHTESHWNNQLNDLFSSMTESLKVNVFMNCRYNLVILDTSTVISLHAFVQ